jgi:hypothetical protein
MNVGSFFLFGMLLFSIFLYYMFCGEHIYQLSTRSVWVYLLFIKEDWVSLQFFTLVFGGTVNSNKLYLLSTCPLCYMFSLVIMNNTCFVTLFH